MASLSYHSQHLAWQQRVRKEQTVASEFSKTFDSFRLSSSMQAPPKSLKSAFPVRRTVRTDHHATPVPSHSSQSPVKPRMPPEDEFEAELRRRTKEVRGKYSRPVITVNGTLQLQQTGFSPVTKRPTTSGSLVPSHRGREQSSGRKKTASVEEVTTPRSHLRTKSLVYTCRRKSDECSAEHSNKKAEKPVEPATEKTQTKEKPQTKEKNSTKEKDQEQVPPQELAEDEEAEEKPADPEAADAEGAETEPLPGGEERAGVQEDGDAGSTASWITTKSQKRYIEELEQLLRSERMKRIIAEEKLAVVRFNTKP